MQITKEERAVIVALMGELEADTSAKNVQLVARVLKSGWLGAGNRQSDLI